MADVARQPPQPLLREDIGDVAHLLLGVDLRRAGRDDPLAGAVGADGGADVRLGGRRSDDT